MSFIDRFKTATKPKQQSSNEIGAVQSNPDTARLIASNNTALDRMNTCKECEHLYKLTNTCNKCGCFMTIKTKLQSSKCPIGKW